MITKPRFVTTNRAGAQSVAVQLGANHAAVGEGYRGGTIPRLHQRGVIFVKRLDVVGHRRVVQPSLGNEHLHDVRKAAPRQEQQLDGVIQVCGVASAGRNDGLKLLDVVAEEWGSQH